MSENHNYIDSFELFCTECDNLCEYTLTGGELSCRCKFCGFARQIIYCSLSHKLCTDKDNNDDYRCPLYNASANEATRHICADHLSKNITITNKYNTVSRFSPNIKYDFTYLRTHKIACISDKCREGKPNADMLIYQLHNDTTGVGYICTECGSVFS